MGYTKRIIMIEKEGEHRTPIYHSVDSLTTMWLLSAIGSNYPGMSGTVPNL